IGGFDTKNRWCTNQLILQLASIGGFDTKNRWCTNQLILQLASIGGFDTKNRWCTNQLILQLVTCFYWRIRHQKQVVYEPVNIATCNLLLLEDLTPKTGGVRTS
ncbi:unnamed protein product, partial [Larinioides sclopetarius]